MPMIDSSVGDYPLQYSAFLTATLQAHRPDLIDNISEATPLWWWLNMKGRKRSQVGGESILQPLMYAMNDIQSFSGYDALDTAPHEGIAPAVFEWKQYQVPIVVPKDQLRANMGKAAVLNLVNAKVKQAEISMIDTLNTDSIANGSDGEIAATPNAKKITGLADVLQDDTQARVYGGIAAATHTWWKNQHNTASAFADFGTEGVAVMRSQYLNASRGHDKPDLILTNQALFEEYEDTLVSEKRFVNTNAADAGFESLAYRGATMMFDRAMAGTASGNIYFLNSNYIDLVVDPGVEMASTPFQDAENVPNGQWAVFSRIFWRGNLTCSNRARQAAAFFSAA